MFGLITLFCVKGIIQMSISDNIYYRKDLGIKVYDLPIPIQSGDIYNKKVARFCADLIQRVSKEENSKLKSPKGLDMHLQMWNYNCNHLFGALWSNSDVVYIVFRGTTCINEWLQDFNYSLELFPINYPQYTLRPSVHGGFLDIYMNFRSKLVKKLRELNPKQIIVAGHSLGGAVATICGYDIKMLGYNGNIIVYNFACPRVGNKELQKSIKNVGLQIYRIVNTLDKVPKLPPEIILNCNNILNPYIYSHCGTLVSFTADLGSISNNHMLECYIYNYLDMNDK